jgi:hypothetical protein
MGNARRITVHVKDAGGGTTGYMSVVSDVPRRGEELLLIDGEGVLSRYRVTNVRHLLFTTPDHHAGSHEIEVECE